MILSVLVLSAASATLLQEAVETPLEEPQQKSRGLHGYIGYASSQPKDRAMYGMGMGFYSAAWSLIDQPLKHFQIGLASGWIVPDVTNGYPGSSLLDVLYPPP